MGGRGREASLAEEIREKTTGGRFYSPIVLGDSVSYDFTIYTDFETIYTIYKYIYYTKHFIYIYIHIIYDICTQYIHCTSEVNIILPVSYTLMIKLKIIGNDLVSCLRFSRAFFSPWHGNQ